MILDSRYIHNKTLSEIKEVLNTILQMPLEITEITEIEDLLGKIILGHERTIYTLNVPELIRVRKNIRKKKFKHITCLSYPKWDLIPKKKWDFARGNDKGQSMFYAATETATAIIEVRPKLNEHITVIVNSRNNQSLKTNLQVIGINKLINIDSRYEIIFKEHVSRYKNLSADLKEKNDLINDFLDEQFMLPVGEDETWKYKISIAITNILLNHESVNGLLYPSIAMKHKGANILLKPEFVDLNFHLTTCVIFDITNENATIVEVEKLYRPLNNPYNLNGYLKWRVPKHGEKEKYEIKI